MSPLAYWEDLESSKLGMLVAACFGTPLSVSLAAPNLKGYQNGEFSKWRAL